MAGAKKSTKKATVVAPAAIPPAEGTPVLALGGDSGTATEAVVGAGTGVFPEAAASEDVTGTPPQPPATPESEASTDTVLVLVGGNGAAGRLIIGRIAYDAVRPRPMARADYERLRVQYDLREVMEP